ncbi:MAG: reverse transcriptase family protein [Pirellulales bacterium]
MFPIYKATELAYHLGTSVAELKSVLQSPSPFYEEFILLDPKKPGKERPVLSVKPPLQRWQSRFHRNVLLNSLDPSEYNHGGRRGRSIKTNAEAHLSSRFVYKADISGFYPSIHDSRVFRLFHERYNCPPPVADLCSRLCTFKHHLALGLSTSPILADQLLRDVDDRIAAACRHAGWVYTRYVDDITISAPHNLGDAGVKSLIGSILRQHGFRLKGSKCEAGNNGDITITGVRIKNGHLDIAKEYAAELDRQLADALSLTHDGPFDGPYYTFGQLSGRVRFVCWVNARRSTVITRKLLKLNPKKMMAHAAERGFVCSKKRVVRPQIISFALD